MKENPNLTYCMIFLREANVIAIKAGLGRHEFGRIPVAGEYICLEDEEKHNFYKVQQILHTGFGSHSAEIYVEESNDLVSDLGQFLPPA